MIGHRSRCWGASKRKRFARALAACSAALWLAGSLSAALGNPTIQWPGTHCPQGPTQNSQQSDNHCAWHCGGLDIQDGGGRGDISADRLVSRIWSLGAIPLSDAALDGEFPPRGPPPVVRQIT